MAWIGAMEIFIALMHARCRVKQRLIEVRVAGEDPAGAEPWTNCQQKQQ